MRFKDIRGPRGPRGQPSFLHLGHDVPVSRQALDVLMAGGMPPGLTREEAEKVMPQLTLLMLSDISDARAFLRNVIDSDQRAAELYVRYFRRPTNNAYGTAELWHGMLRYAFDECRRVLGL